MSAAGSPGGQRPPLLSLAGVGKTFGGDTVALDDFTLDVRRGEFLSLLGPSGCGKSTVLRLVAGLIRPGAGRLDWAGGAPDRPPGFVFQEPTLMPWATVAENVRLPLRLRGGSHRDTAAEIDDALALVGLDAAASAYPRELSGGMKMRVSIARALVTRPALILMDEPFAALDEINRFKLNDELLALREKLDCTVIFVTHSVYEAVFLSERIAVMTPRPGRVHATLSVPEPYPRDAGFRAAPAYAEQCRAASAALAEAMGAP